MSTSETVTLAVDGKVMPAVGLGLGKSSAMLPLTLCMQRSTRATAISTAQPIMAMSVRWVRG